jgi:hypothetical protein
MRSHITRTLGIAAAALMLASAADAQGKSNAKGKAKDHDNKAKAGEVRRADGILLPGERRDDRDIRGNGVKVPPGLAKKPGQMPPGQYKKRYGTNEGATVLGDIMRRRGYDVLRVVPTGNSQYVYYRTPDGIERRALINQGTDRLRFSNVPSTILREVLARLY